MKSTVFTFKKKNSNSRGISQIVGSLFMLAIVTVIGISLLFTGLDNINQFRDFLVASSFEQDTTFREDLMIDHIRFDPADGSSELNIWIRNVDSVPTTIEAITVVKVDTQDLLLNDNDVFTQLLGHDVVLFTYDDESDPELTLPDDCLDGSGEDGWTDPDCESSQYTVSATTIQGSFVQEVARPFGT